MFETPNGMASQAQEHGQILELIARGRPAEESLTALLRLREKTTPGLRATFQVLDEDGKTVRQLATPDAPPGDTEPRPEASGTPAWSAPVLDAGKAVIGTLSCYLAEARPPTPLELRLTETAAQIASIALTRDREERRLRDSEAALNEAQRMAQIGSWDWNHEQQTGHWSQEMYALTGLPPLGTVADI